MKTYSTSQIAGLIGVHTNTVRLYEELGLISKPKRKNNGYRIFTDLHKDQLILTRLALSVEILQSGLRKEAVEIIKKCANGEYYVAINKTKLYLNKIKTEQQAAEEAIEIVGNLLHHKEIHADSVYLTRKQAAENLKITIDTLRNWEMNGLLTVKRKQNGYRVYDKGDIKILKIIRCLRKANYSINSILRLLSELSYNSKIDIKHSINTPKDTEDIVSVCDNLLTSLKAAQKNACKMLDQIYKMQITY